MAAKVEEENVVGNEILFEIFVIVKSLKTRKILFEKKYSYNICFFTYDWLRIIDYEIFPSWL